MDPYSAINVVSKEDKPKTEAEVFEEVIMSPFRNAEERKKRVWEEDHGFDDKLMKFCNSS